MELSLSEAADLLGKSVRQLRYAIKKNELPARKKGGRWVIDSEVLPLSNAQRTAAAMRLKNLQDAADEAISPVGRSVGKVKKGRYYSVRDLRAYKSGIIIYKETSLRLGEEHPASRLLEDSLTALCRGCHEYQPNNKSLHYNEARKAAASAVIQLLIKNGADESMRIEFADRIEQDYIPFLSSLVRSTEKRSYRKRFQGFGSRRDPTGY